DNSSPPDISFFKIITNLANNILSNEDENIRPKDDNGKTGGLINLSSFDEVIIIPDLHARRNFLKDLLFWKNKEKSVFELLESNEAALLCLGDGVHSEGTFASRWTKAFEEYAKDFREKTYMDMEIADSFNLMIAIMCLKIRYSNNFHFLKGNHENITNETGNGNFSFAKYANEGAMVLEYFEKFYDMEMLDIYSQFEKNLPLFVVGKNFLASHAEPQYFFEREKIINYRNDGDLIEALTWTENFSSQRGTVDKYLSYYLNNNDTEHTYYFGGHRPITGKFNKINKDRYIQIHNPAKEIVAVINQNNQINLNDDIKILKYL
ncbi:MAG TPA: metallophosphoesterase, partial [Spirochaetota bacterium]|nr:metallophosphoesterase [Spirochaetota bacterium]